MAGTARSYDASKVILGPGDLWAKVAVPAGGARATIDTTSSVHTPDATAHPNAKHIGMTVEGTVVTYKPEIQNFSCDELTAPFLSRIVSEPLSIKGAMYQVFDWDLLELMTVGGVKGTGTGYEEMPVGGRSAIPTTSIILIAPDITTPGTYYTIVQLYKTFNQAGWEFGVTRKNPANLAFEFMGQSVTTRTVGDQIGNVWKKVV